MKSTFDYKSLIRKGVPAVLIPGIIFAGIYSIDNLKRIKNYYESELIFPRSGVIKEVDDGDTFRMESGHKIRMLGIDAPDRGKPGYEEAKKEIEGLKNQTVWLEYDRYQDDKYGRILAWVWMKCEDKEPKFFPANYMHLSGNESRNYVVTKPDGCLRGELLNRTMVEKKLAEPVSYEKRGRLKYLVN